MEFAPEGARYEPLDPELLPPLVVAWRTQAGADSGPLHTGLRERFEAGDPEVRQAMSTAAGAARTAREALLERDLTLFHTAIDATLEARRQMLPLDPRHIEMIELARASGAAANYTGSGGAIVAACRGLRHSDQLIERLRAAGCDAHRIRRTRR